MNTSQSGFRRPRSPATRQAIVDQVSVLVGLYFVTKMAVLLEARGSERVAEETIIEVKAKLEEHKNSINSLTYELFGDIPKIDPLNTELFMDRYINVQHSTVVYKAKHYYEQVNQWRDVKVLKINVVKGQLAVEGTCHDLLGDYLAFSEKLLLE